tara:strand:- start:1722 stop:1946 length:225 start_codon:yes stop_codon:yes gene_type:complete
MKKYVITNTSDLSNVDYSLVEQSSLETTRESLDSSLALISFYGDTPSFLEGVTQYDKEEIKDIVTSSDWQIEEE